MIEVFNPMSNSRKKLTTAEEQARLDEAVALTETQIAALLLSGRSRPFIRDELVISLNTVHAHARNIYSKCGVQSQQEFMDFVHLDSREGE